MCHSLQFPDMHYDQVGIDSLILNDLPLSLIFGYPAPSSDSVLFSKQWVNGTLQPSYIYAPLTLHLQVSERL